MLDQNSPECTYEIAFKSTTAQRIDANLQIKLHSDATHSYQITIPLVGIAHAQCTSFTGYPALGKSGSGIFFPLRPTASDAVINCFYNTSSSLSAVTQAQYQYNPAGSANALSADLISAQFKGGFQVSLTASTSTSSCNAASSSTSNPTNTNCAGTSPSAPDVSQASLSQDIQQLTQGGDFGVKVLWPFIDYVNKSGSFQVSNFLTPKVGFTVGGLSSTVNATAGTDVNAYYSDESYLQFLSIPLAPGQGSAASIFFDHRWGLESVDSNFVQSASLTHHNFIMQQISVGIIFNNTIKVSGERYKGANQNLYLNSSGTGLPVNNFNNWILSVQFAPPPKS